jgi:hypothetical protein
LLGFSAMRVSASAAVPRSPAPPIDGLAHLAQGMKAPVDVPAEQDADAAPPPTPQSRPAPASARRR